MADRQRFIDLLNEHLRKQGLSPADLARRLEVNPSTVSRWLDAGYTSMPTQENVIGIAKVLNLNRTELYVLLAVAGYEDIVTFMQSPVPGQDAPQTNEIATDPGNTSELLTSDILPNTESSHLRDEAEIEKRSEPSVINEEHLQTIKQNENSVETSEGQALHPDTPEIEKSSIATQLSSKWPMVLAMLLLILALSAWPLYGLHFFSSILPALTEATPAAATTAKLPTANSAEIYYFRGLAHVKQQQREAALGDFSQAILLNPDYADAYFGRGVTLSGLGKYEEAMADFTKVISLRPNYTLAYYQRGLLHKIRKELDAAIADFNQAIALKPDFSLSFRDRGATYRLLNRLPEALADLRHYLELQPDVEDRAAVQKQIAEIEVTLEKPK